MLRFILTAKNGFFFPNSYPRHQSGILTGSSVDSVQGRLQVCSFYPQKNTNANKGEFRAMPLRIINIMSRQKTAQTQEVI